MKSGKRSRGKKGHQVLVDAMTIIRLHSQSLKDTAPSAQDFLHSSYCSTDLISMEVVSSFKCFAVPESPEKTFYMIRRMLLKNFETTFHISFGSSGHGHRIL